MRHYYVLSGMTYQYFIFFQDICCQSSLDWQLRAYMCVCVCARMSVCACMCACVFVCHYAWVVNGFMHAYVCMFVCVCVLIHIYAKWFGHNWKGHRFDSWSGHFGIPCARTFTHITPVYPAVLMGTWWSGVNWWRSPILCVNKCQLSISCIVG